MSAEAAIAFPAPWPVATLAEPRVVVFGSNKPVTCAVMDYARRLVDSLNARRPGFAAIATVEPERPAAFVSALAAVLRRGAIAHLQLPIEGWGDSLLPGAAAFAARALTRRGRIAITLHEWTSLHPLRYLSLVPDLVAADGFVFVSPRERQAFQSTPWVGRGRKAAAPVIPIGPNIMPARIDPARVAAERVRLRGAGPAQAQMIVGFFGVLYASKRPDLLLRTARVLHARGVKARLLVCGDFLWDRPGDRAAFMTLADQLGLRDWLDFRGRIDDEGELMAALSACDAFLLPYADGVSLRRGSFQAVAQIALPLVTTRPEQADEFDAMPALKAKIDSAATALCPADASPERFAAALMEVVARKPDAFAVALDGLWREAAGAHLSFYERLTGA
jgi:glycosyltransferase involved in cell wall biosynthesis